MNHSPSEPGGPSGTPMVLPLEALGRDSLPVAGGKASSLGVALAAGLPVPDGFCVTTSAYAAAREAAPALHAVVDELAATTVSDSDRLRELAGKAREAVESAAVPEVVARVVGEAYRQLGGGIPVSVRSSATAEDLPSASFAGQHDTFLNVVGEEAVVGAVRSCWASLWTDRAVVYRAATGVDHRSARMAVVVQRMVEARAAGVMFTAHPLREGTGQAVIEASPGLGEAVVSGTVATDHFVVAVSTGEVLERTVARKTGAVVPAPGGGVRQVELPEEQAAAPCLDDEDLRQLAALAGRVEEAYSGVPQDTEFALGTDGKLWLLQARPITTRPSRAPVPGSAGGPAAAAAEDGAGAGATEAAEDGAVRWESPIPGAIWIRRQVVEHMPGPLSPLFEEIYLRQGLQRSYHDIAKIFMGSGFSVDDVVDPPLFGTVHGYAYQRADFRLPPKVLVRMVGMTLRGTRWLFRDGIAYWRDEALPAYRAIVERWRSEDPSSLPDGKLLRGIRELGSADAAYWFGCTLAVGAAKVTDSLLGSFLSVALRGRGLTSGMFLRGFPSKTIEGDARLEDLAGLVRKDGELRKAVLTAPPAHLMEVLRSHPAGGPVLAGLEGYFHDYGHQIYSLDFAEPTQVGDPMPTLLTLRAKIAGEPHDVQAQQARLARDRDALTHDLMHTLDPVRRRGLQALLRLAQRLAPLREEALFHLGAGWPTLRALAAELGGRLCSAGILAEPSDVYFLETPELEAAIAARAGGEPQPQLAGLARERRMLRERRKRLVPPAAVPPEARMHWGPFDLSSRESQHRPPASGEDEPAGTLRGFAVSPGRVTAPASVVLGAEDFGTMTPGTILVCPTTTPAWTALFAQARGLVTDIGGILAHGSIVAREYGIPAVMGTASATHRIRTGDTITVDGDLGLVHLDHG